MPARGRSTIAGETRTLLRALSGAAAGARHWRDVETFCLFIGHARSGSSLVGSLLDAHPEAVIAHELDSLAYVRRPYSRKLIWALLVDKAHRDALAGRVEGDYSYAVEGQAQGEFTRLRVIGDKRANATSMRLGRDPAVLERTQAMMRVPLRFVHVIRNPFDNISTFHAKSPPHATFRAAIERYFELCETIERTRERVDRGAIFDVRHEDFVAQPAHHLRALCQHLGLAADQGYLDACAAIVRPSPHRSREKATWSDDAVEEVLRRIDKFPCLAGYDFEN